MRFFQTLSPVEHQFYDMVMKLMKIIIVMPATNAISERSFSALRRMKTWLRSTMNQTRLNWCMILHIHNDDTDKLNIVDVAHKFVSIWLLQLCDYSYYTMQSWKRIHAVGADA